MPFDAGSILKMIGALGSTVGGVAGSFGGSASSTSLTPPQTPTLDQLTLNPQVMGQNPPKVPYDFGQGQNVLPAETQPPMAPPPGVQGTEGTPEKKKPKTFADHLNDFSKVLGDASKTMKSTQNSSIAQRMFQEQQQKTFVSNQVRAGMLEKFKRRDQASQILANAGLL